MYNPMKATGNLLSHGWAVGLVAAAFVLTGCGDDDDDPSLTCNSVMQSYYANRCVIVTSSGTASVEEASDGCLQLEQQAREAGCSAQFQEALGCMQGVRNSEETSDSEVVEACKSCDELIGAITSCSSNGGGGSKNPAPSWYSSTCTELGGVTTNAGACYIACTSDSDCPTAELRCGTNSVWSHFACEPRPEVSSVKGCGDGWADEYGCKMMCDGKDSSCPAGWRCVEGMRTPYYCTGYVGGGGGGSSGCPSWCGYPYCDGDCAGCC